VVLRRSQGTISSVEERRVERFRNELGRRSAAYPGTVLRIYLDQKDWVGLLKARVGHRDGDHYRDVLLVLREAVEHGWVSLPLSTEHVMEVHHRTDWKSRVALAETMVELSRWHTIGNHRRLYEAEIDHSLSVMFGRPAVPRSAQVFGVGLNHAFGRNVIDYKPPPEVPDEMREPIRRRANEILEFAALIGAPPGFEAPNYDPDAGRAVARAFAKEQEQMRIVRRPHGYHRGDANRRATSVEVFGEFENGITDALKAAGLHWGHVYDSERAGMERLVELTPTMAVHLELRRLRHEASPKPWEENDMNDLSALSRAIVYCDVVVTERVWTNFVERTDLEDRFGTKVLRDLTEIVPYAIGAAQVA
jgi:hypothetical protein